MDLKFYSAKTKHQTINFSSTPTHLATKHHIGKHRENEKSYKMGVKNWTLTLDFQNGL